MGLQPTDMGHRHIGLSPASVKCRGSNLLCKGLGERCLLFYMFCRCGRVGKHARDDDLKKDSGATEQEAAPGVSATL